MTSGAQAIELEEQASRAFDAYAAIVREQFFEHVRGEARANQGSGRAAAMRDGDGVAAWPGRDQGIVEVADGLVHHWAGAVYIRGVTLRHVLEVSSAYPDYRAMYRSVVASRLLGREGNSFRVLLRVREGLLGAHAILDIQSKVEYAYPGERRAYAVSSDEEIREVENAGQADERHLPAGHGSGYLWRSGTLTSFVEDDEGVHVELHMLGLSRTFSALLRWITDPIAWRIGRKSVEGSLEDLRRAVLAARSTPGR